MNVKIKMVDKATGQTSDGDGVVDRDECNRPGTTLEGLQALQPVRGAGNFVTAGNASQLSDGAAAVVLMEAKAAEKRGLEPLGLFKGVPAGTPRVLLLNKADRFGGDPGGLLRTLRDAADGVLLCALRNPVGPERVLAVT